MNEIAQRVTVTIDNREIARLTGKRHADVCRDIQTSWTSFKSANANLRRPISTPTTASGSVMSARSSTACFPASYARRKM